MQPQLVFAFWPPLLFFVFILLSTLRLDFWLSVWTGAVAATLQMALVFVLLPREPGATAEDMPLFYVGRSTVLFCSGIVAGLVAMSLRRQFENSILAGAARDRVTNLFGQHVSPSVVERLLATQAEPPSELRTICVLFSRYPWLHGDGAKSVCRGDGGAAQRLLRRDGRRRRLPPRHHQ